METTLFNANYRATTRPIVRWSLGFALLLVSGAIGCAKTDQAAPPATTTTTVIPSTTTAAAKLDTTGTTRSNLATTSTGRPDQPTSTPPQQQPGDEAFCREGAASKARSKDLDPAKALDAYLRETKATFAKLSSLAPAELAADMATLNAAVQKLNSLEEMSALESNPAIKAANDHLEKFSAAHCGF